LLSHQGLRNGEFHMQKLTNPGWNADKTPVSGEEMRGRRNPNTHAHEEIGKRRKRLYAPTRNRVRYLEHPAFKWNHLKADKML